MHHSAYMLGKHGERERSKTCRLKKRSKAKHVNKHTREAKEDAVLHCHVTTTSSCPAFAFCTNERRGR